MNGGTTLGRIPRTVIYRRSYGYHAEPGHLLVDVAQGDPAEALITNRTRRNLFVKFTGRVQLRQVRRVPRGVPFPRNRSSLDRCQAITGSTYGLPPGFSLWLALRRVSSVVPYRVRVAGADIEVSGGSGPDIIIEP